jgi:hypothetical protein
MANEQKERLTGMLTFVVTPSTRTRIVTAAEKRGVPYATVLRWAVDAWLEANAVPTANDDPTEVGE